MFFLCREGFHQVFRYHALGIGMCQEDPEDPEDPENQEDQEDQEDKEDQEDQEDQPGRPRGPRFVCEDIYLFNFHHVFGFHTSSSSSIITNSIDYSRAAPPIPITGTSSRVIPAVKICGAL